MIHLSEDPVTCEYALTPDEAKAALIAGGKVRSDRSLRRTATLETVGLGIGVVIFGGNAIVSPAFYGNYFVLAVCVAGILAAWVMPRRSRNRIAARAAEGTIIYLTVTPEKIEVRTASADWSLDLDGSPGCATEKQVIAILLPTGRILGIPMRALNGHPQAAQWIRAGTHEMNE